MTRWILALAAVLFALLSGGETNGFFLLASLSLVGALYVNATSETRL